MPPKDLFGKISSIKLHNVTKKYGDRFAIKDLDLEIEGGELLILIGPSGSGKTTTLRTINRLIEPDAGNIRINGKDIIEVDPVILRRNIGYVIQNIGLFPHMTIGENIGLIPKLEGLNGKDINERVKELLNFVSLPAESFIERYPRQLSGGQQQRVGLARSLAMDPHLLLMDEPFGALDPILRKQLQEEFSTIKEELGKTIIFVTHDIEEALKLGDRIAIMDNAQLIQVGTPEELIFEPKNDMVANIVDSRHKFRHIDSLKVKDMMCHLGPKYFFDPEMKVQDALAKMRAHDIEFGILDKGMQSPCIIEMKDMVKSELEYGTDDPGSSMILKDMCRFLPSFTQNTPLSTGLEALKERDSNFALITDAGTISGLLQSNEVLHRLL